MFFKVNDFFHKNAFFKVFTLQVNVFYIYETKHKRELKQRTLLCNTSSANHDGLVRTCTTFVPQGLQSIIFCAPEGQKQNYKPNFRESSINYQICLYVTSLYIACGLIIIVATGAVLDFSQLQNC